VEAIRHVCKEGKLRINHNVGSHSEMEIESDRE
jgi:hypothetical protein